MHFQIMGSKGYERETFSVYGNDFVLKFDSHHGSNDKNQTQMANIQNEENSSKVLNFKTQTKDGDIRNPTIKE